jgi:hypothetical protein
MSDQPKDGKAPYQKPVVQTNAPSLVTAPTVATKATQAPSRPTPIVKTGLTRPRGK